MTIVQYKGGMNMDENTSIQEILEAMYMLLLQLANIEF